MSITRLAQVSWVVLALLGGCASNQRPTDRNQAQAAASTASLSSESSITCRVDEDCSVCYRAGTCGEPIATTDPTLAAAECHASPAAFCMARRARCDTGHCVAR
ncbi:MAG: hypothetical protein Q8Q09_25280 [Deltaproteobacteria bacterium]|nr:hypothetical protein [Deltaproteobacteria bacterium]